MLTNKRCCAACLGFALFLGAPANRVRAATIFSDFGTGYLSNSASNGLGACVSGNVSLDCGPATDRWVAAAFTPTGNFVLDHISLALTYVSGTNGAVVNLQQDSGGLPGAMVLETWSPMNLEPCVGGGCVPNPVITLNSSSGVNLHAGTQYWVVTEGFDPSTLVFWWDNTLGDAGGTLSLTDGRTWFPVDTVAGTLPTFDVIGAAVPEPSSLAMGGAVLILIAFSRRGWRR